MNKLKLESGFLFRRACYIPLLLLLLPLLIFACSAINIWHPDLDWHDQQRIYQLLLLTMGAVSLMLLGNIQLPNLAFLMLYSIFVIGLVASWSAEWPGWAVKEWSRYIGLLLLPLTVGTLADKFKIKILLLSLIAFVGFAHVLQFLIYYASAFISGMYLLDADLLFNGFSNPRFFGQFQIMLMPILALLALELSQQKRKWLAVVLLGTLAVQWCIALTLGGRGLWLGLAVSHIALIIINRSFCRLLFLQFIAATLGASLFLVLFRLIPEWLDLSPTLRDSLRVTLSGRGPIWQWAWDMAVANPWFGVGPMHFSATLNPIAAHPHQVILQWAAEWGFVATLFAMLLAGWGVVHGALYLRRNMAENYDAALWSAIVGALVLAQVDGVFVMPYTETWLAILIGLALAQWSAQAQQVQQTRLQRYGVMLLALPVLVILGRELLVEAPRIAEVSHAYRIEHKSGYVPRFWQQGWIPMDGKLV